MKNILVINGHPDKDSLCKSLAEQYQKGAEAAGNTCKLVHLADLEFDLNLRYGYHKRMELEPCLLEVFEQIKAANHLVFVFPSWWASFPALLKGFIDRVFLPGFTYQPIEGSPLPKKLLKGKTARLIVTMDAPVWYNYLIYHQPGHNAMKHGVLEYCGVKPVKATTFGMVKASTDIKRKKWLHKVELLGRKGE